MRDWIYRHRFGVSVAILMTLPLLLMYFHGRRGRGTTFVERAAVSIAGASQSTVTSLVGWGGELVENYLLLVGVQESNRRLELENEKLMGEALTAKRLAVENRSLRRLVGLKEGLKGMDMAAATVVSRELTPYYRVSRMSIETGDGPVPAADMAVVTTEGLLGRVVKLAGGYADVMLLADKRSRVACEVLGRGVLGMVIGSGRPDGYQATMQVSAAEKPLEDGAVIQTSGHDLVFPRGIEIGYVTDPSRAKQNGPFTEYRVVLAVNPNNVEHALVLARKVPAGVE